MVSKKNLITLISLTVLFPVIYLMITYLNPQKEILTNGNFRLTFDLDERHKISQLLDKKNLHEIAFNTLKNLQENDKNFVHLNVRNNTITYLGDKLDLIRLSQIDFQNEIINVIKLRHKEFKELTKEEISYRIAIANTKIKQLQNLTLDNTLFLEDEVLQAIKENIIREKVAVLLANQNLRLLEGFDINQINPGEQIVSVKFNGFKLIKQQEVPLKILFYAFLGACFGSIIIFTEKLFLKSKKY